MILCWCLVYILTAVYLGQYGLSNCIVVVYRLLPLLIFLARAKVVWNKCNIMHGCCWSEFIATFRLNIIIFSYINSLSRLVALLLRTGACVLTYSRSNIHSRGLINNYILSARIPTLILGELRLPLSVRRTSWAVQSLLLLHLLSLPVFSFIVETWSSNRLEMQPHSFRFFDNAL